MCQDCQPELQLYQCIDGENAFTITTAAFTMPAESGGVTIQVSDVGQFTGKWASPGQIIYISSGLLITGYFAVVSSNSTSISVINIENTSSGNYTQNAPPGTIFPIGSKVSPAGIQGPAGPSGSSGATGSTGPAGANGQDGVAIIDSNWFDSGDRYNLSGGTTTYSLFGDGSGNNVTSTIDNTLWMNQDQDELWYTAIITLNLNNPVAKTTFGVGINSSAVASGLSECSAFIIGNGVINRTDAISYRIEGKVTRISTNTFRAQAYLFDSISNNPVVSNHFNGSIQNTAIDFTTTDISGPSFSSNTYLLPFIATSGIINSYSLIHFSVWAGKKI